MTEQDFKDIGVSSFGVRRKLSLALRQLSAVEGSPKSDSNKRSQSELDSSCDELESLESGSDVDISTIAGPSFTSTPNKSCMDYLSDHPQGKELIDRFAAGKPLSTLQRRLFIRIQTANLVSKWGLYPTSAQKEQFARDIVKTFPLLKDTTPGMEGHEIFYHQGQGFLEYRLKTIRLGVPISSKKRKSTLSKEETTKENTDSSAEDTPAIIEKIHEMKYTPPTKENKSRILSLFKETHPHRRNWLMEKTVDITTFLQEYPRMQDMPELVNVEFQQLFPDSHSSFVRKWESFYVPRILQIALEEYPSITSTVKSFEGGDQNLCAAVVLAHMLFRTSKKVSSRADAIKYLYQNVPVGTDLADEARKKDVRYKQPFLLAVGPIKQPTQFVMVVDQLSIPAGDSPVTAIDALFKAYYCFNVEFPLSISQFWEFLAFEIYEVMDKKEAKPQVRSLASVIRGLAAK